MNKPKYSLSDLLYLMARLRNPETGCPWDIKQTFKTIAPFTLEEAYEVVDAIEREDFIHLQEELGDLLLQVIFYAQMASEQQRFDFSAVVVGLVEKLLRRHPHVFPDGDLKSVITSKGLSAEQVKGAWELQKSSERKTKGQQRLLDDVPHALPALNRAQKLQKRAAKAGFDWLEIAEVKAKVEEELAELYEACDGAESRERQEEELGDLMFSVVNLARHLNLDAESALRKANHKFTGRFNFVEKRMRESELALTREYAEAMEAFWQEAKEEAKPKH